MSSDIAFPVKQRLLTLWKPLLTTLFPEFGNLTSQTLEDEITNYLPSIRTTSGHIAYNGVHVLSMSSYSNCVNVIRYCVSGETKTLTLWKPLLTTLFPEFGNLTSQTLEDEITNDLPPIRTTSGHIAYNDVHVLSMSSYSNCVNIIRYCIYSETKTLTLWKPLLTTLFPEFSNFTSQTLED